MKRITFLKSLLLAAGLMVGASAWATDVPTPVYFNDFSSTTGLTIVGDDSNKGAFVDDTDLRFGQVFQNASSTSPRSNYLLLPNTVFSSFTTANAKTAMTIGFWVNAKNAGEASAYTYAPLFAAYGAAPNPNNTSPMMCLQSRGLFQVNCAGWCDYVPAQNATGKNNVYNTNAWEAGDGDNYTSGGNWLDDDEWHYCTIVLSGENAYLYLDGVLKNQWDASKDYNDGTNDITDTTQGGLLSNGSSLTYVCLGGNQAWAYGDNDAAFMFDDFAVYDAALTADQIQQIMSDKFGYPTVTWDFQQYVVDKGLVYSGGTQTIELSRGNKIGKDENNVDIYHVNDLADFCMNGRFAIQTTDIKFRCGSSKNEITGKGLTNTANARSFAILNLAVGDVVTLTTNDEAVKFIGTNVTNSNGTTPAKWDFVVSGEPYTVTTAGRLELQLQKLKFIYKVEIKTAASETISGPSIVLSGVNGINREVTITNGASNLFANVKSYYTTDGSTPTAASTLYTAPFSIDQTKTINAITISTSSLETASNVTSEEIEAGLTVTLAEPTIKPSTMTQDGIFYIPTYSIVSDNSSTLLSPSATLSATFNGETVDISNGTFQPNTNGTLVVTASADGYTSSETSIETSSLYIQLWQSRDFSTLTEDDIKTNYSSWSKSSSTGRWASWKNATYTYYNVTNGGTGYNNITFDDHLMIRNNVAQLVLGFGIGRNNGENITISNTEEGDIVVIKLYNGFGNDVSESNTYSEYYLREGSNVSKKLANSPLLVQATIFRPATASKTITSVGWATYCSPYALDFTNSIDNLTAAYIVTGGANGVLAKTEVTGTVPAGTGLLLKGNGNCVIPVVASSNTDVSANKLVGVTANTQIAAEAGYVLMASPSLGFYLNTNAFTVGANTAYLPANFDGSGARMSFFGFDDTTTGISATLNNKEEKSNIYNLNGQRVSQPEKGLYIVNGKKVIMK